MRLQKRDVAILTDIALHGVMSRDQVMKLGYFASIPRANARLCPMTSLKLLKRLQRIELRDSRQSLYCTTAKAADLLDERVANLVRDRKHTPRFIDHSLMVVDVRVELQRLGGLAWRSEVEVRHRYSYGGRQNEFRPDGLIFVAGNCLFVEADRCNASRQALTESFSSYDRYAASGVFQAVYRQAGFRVLVVTVGKRRALSIHALAKKHRVAVSVVTLDELKSAAILREVLL